jgi:hypothetical protein
MTDGIPDAHWAFMVYSFKEGTQRYAGRQAR